MPLKKTVPKWYCGVDDHFMISCVLSYPGASRLGRDEPSRTHHHRGLCYPAQWFVECSGFLPGITEQFGVEGTFQSHLVQPLCSEQEQLQLGHVSQSPPQSCIECFQEWSIHHLSGNLQCFTSLKIKHFFLVSNLNLPSSSVKHDFFSYRNRYY